jgi:PHD/YefM family antitoxin component YafN of YafNO toxin-antitoxin module
MGAVKEKARELIESLSDEDVEVLIKMAERLAEWEATQELLEDEEMLASIKRGLKDLERGDTLYLEELRKSVSG